MYKAGKKKKKKETDEGEATGQTLYFPEPTVQGWAR
jgi:hypothetical protein